MKTILEEKVTKTEMIDMIVYEEQQKVEKEFSDYLAKYTQKGIDKKINDELDSLYGNHFKQEYPALQKELFKFYGKDSLKFSPAYKPTHIKTKGKNRLEINYLIPRRKLNYTMQGVHNPIIGISKVSKYFQFYIAVSVKKNGGVNIVIPIKETKEIKAFIKKIKESNKLVEVEYATYIALDLKKTKLVNGAKAAKAKLVRTMLESTTEGKNMLKQLTKIKTSITKDMLLIS